MHIIDFHCDLLSYLANKPDRTARDSEARCSLPQLAQGNVCLQMLAVYSETGKKSVAFAEKQFVIFQQLQQQFPNEVVRHSSLDMPKDPYTPHVLLAIENMSGLCEESESLECAFTRFDQYMQSAGPIVYVSLTWNHENRFGGGNLSQVGLKRDGELFLDYLSSKKIAIDLSHTSDALAYDIINYIDKKGLSLLPIASHSNFRKICDQPRNLPDDLAKEIIRRDGVIGLNFCKRFIGPNYPSDFARHVDYARSLGGFNHYCFGADFFHAVDLPDSIQPSFITCFYPEAGDASCYPKLIHYLNDVFTKQELEKVAHQNATQFLQRLAH